MTSDANQQRLIAKIISNNFLIFHPTNSVIVSQVVIIATKDKTIHIF